jgi:hypothetical protein
MRGIQSSFVSETAVPIDWCGLADLGVPIETTMSLRRFLGLLAKVLIEGAVLLSAGIAPAIGQGAGQPAGQPAAAPMVPGVFDWQPVTTTNIISVLGIVVVILGFYFSARSLRASQGSLKASQASLKNAADNAQAQLFAHMLAQGRDLQWKYLDMFLSGDTNKQARQRQFQGMVISYYSSCFELCSVLSMPPAMHKLLEAELKAQLADGSMRKIFEDNKHLYSKEFLTYVHHIEGV